MPQFDISTFPSQIFWLVLSFTFLYIVMARIGLPTLREVLHDRKFKISDNLDKAEKMKNEAEEAYKDFTSSLNEAKHKASDLINQANLDASKTFEEKNQQLDLALKQKLDESEKNMSNIEQEVIEQMSDVMSGVSSEIVEKLIGIQIEKESIKNEIIKYYN